MSKIIEKLKSTGYVFLALFAGYLINAGGFFTPSSQVSELSTASVLTPEFKEIVAENTVKQCDFQEEINQSFDRLDPSSPNYEVLYEVTYSKYETDKYHDCELPNSKIDELGLVRVDTESLGEIPVLDDFKSNKSQIFPEIDSTYYERAYGYVPERPTPVAKY